MRVTQGVDECLLLLEHQVKALTIENPSKKEAGNHFGLISSRYNHFASSKTILTINLHNLTVLAYSN